MLEGAVKIVGGEVKSMSYSHMPKAWLFNVINIAGKMCLLVQCLNNFYGYIDDCLSITFRAHFMGESTYLVIEIKTYGHIP